MITVLHVRVGAYKLFSPFSGLNPELVMTYNVHSVALSSVSKVMLLSRADLKIRLQQGRSMMFETEPCHYRVARGNFAVLHGKFESFDSTLY